MRALKTVFFHLLYTFRGLFRLACKILGGLSLLGFVFSLFWDHFTTGQSVFALALSVSLGALAWYYDVLLLKLKPDNVDLILMQ
ncbi:hypothetical protein [Pseudomonas sp. B392_1p]|uniref:hypothetical protein n=1 Tax=Pseudomonas sp. B392_1p TaxID=3457507 RepID=UPI003FD679A6